MFTRYPEGLASALEKLGASSVAQADTSRVTKPMYIVRPLAEGEHRRAVSPFATHPPLEKRIGVLRSMAGGAGLGAYERAYREVAKRRIVGSRSLASAEEIPIEKPRGTPGTVPLTRRERAREASDAFLSASGYERRPCGQCGALLKIPPRLHDRVHACPRCGARI